MGVDCSLILKRSDGALLEIDLDRFRVFDNLVDDMNKFLPTHRLLDILRTGLNLERVTAVNGYVSFWRGYALAVIENLSILHLPKDYTIIEAGIFSEQHPIISQLYNERKARNIEDGYWILLRNS